MDIEIIKNANTKYIGKQIQYFKEINSTHLYAKENYNKMKNGEILLADSQTTGIGTKGRKWHTGKEKNIAMSIILFPKCKVNQLENFTTKIASEISKVIYGLYGYNLEIKKPNDLFLNNKKISGILTEAHTLSNEVKFLIISIGFNVNEEEFNKDTEKIATSLKKEFGKEFSREIIIKNIIESLEKIVDQL